MTVLKKMTSLMRANALKHRMKRIAEGKDDPTFKEQLNNTYIALIMREDITQEEYGRISLMYCDENLNGLKDIWNSKQAAA